MPGPSPQVQMKAIREVRAGGISAEESHVVWHVGMRCRSCTRPGVVLFQIFAPKAEFMERFYEKALAIYNRFGRIPEQPMNFGGSMIPHVLVDRFAACKACCKDAEREVAHVESWWPVWIEWGPGSGKVSASVPDSKPL